jgi:hypothetical protein
MTALKAFPQQEFQKITQQWQHGWTMLTVSYSKVIPLSKL